MGDICVCGHVEGRHFRDPWAWTTYAYLPCNDGTCSCRDYTPAPAGGDAAPTSRGQAIEDPAGATLPTTDGASE